MESRSSFSSESDSSVDRSVGHEHRRRRGVNKRQKSAAVFSHIHRS